MWNTGCKYFFTCDEAFEKLLFVVGAVCVIAVESKQFTRILDFSRLMQLNKITFIHIMGALD